LNKGVLPSVLGVDGYNPSAVQYDVKDSKPEATSLGASTTPATTNTPTPASAPIPVSTPSPVPVVVKSQPKKSMNTSDGLKTFTSLSIEERMQKIDAAIETIMKYRTAGDGGQALKLLLTFVKNIVDQPNELK
jgi:hypothetical protein